MGSDYDLLALALGPNRACSQSVEIESVGVGFDVKSETSRPSDSTRPVPVARLIAYRRGQRI